MIRTTRAHKLHHGEMARGENGTRDVGLQGSMIAREGEVGQLKLVAIVLLNGSSSLSQAMVLRTTLVQLESLRRPAMIATSVRKLFNWKHSFNFVPKNNNRGNISRPGHSGKVKLVWTHPSDADEFGSNCGSLHCC